MTNVRISLVVLLMMGSCAPPGQAQTLGVGDPAPKLDVKAFVKGEPVSKFELGKNYVVEFWATWCVPCKTSIPHLTELQKKNPDVIFIAVSIAEEDQANVKPFVEEMGDKMAYRVAIDSVPEKEKGNQGVMAKTWMMAAGQNGIPTAFVVNKEGKIAWIGYPMELDRPLEKIVAGTWDVKATLEEKAKMMKMESKLAAALRSGDPKRVVAAIDEVIAEVPSAEMNLGPRKLSALIKIDEQDKALEYAKRLFKSELNKQPDGLNGLAWAIIDPEAGLKPSSKLIELAVEIARGADLLAGEKDGAIADTLAVAYFNSGDAKKAVDTEERAIRLMKEAGEKNIRDLEDRLEKYKRAAR
jgi:thiol-disulfide isomerase/thioredoxin